eukprot:5171291-Amphidinium_carterae.1
MLQYKGRRTQDTNNERFCRWQVSCHAALACANSVCANSACIGKGFPFSRLTAKMNKHPPQPRSMTNFCHCAFETQNMSVGCSAGVIHVGTRRGRWKWLPMRARDTTKFAFTPL